jgi:hypothetical protein
MAQVVDEESQDHNRHGIDCKILQKGRKVEFIHDK